MSDIVLSTSDSSSDDERRSDWQNLRSKSASLLTSHTCDLTTSALPPIHQSPVEASSIIAASQWAPDARGNSDCLQADGNLVATSTTDGDGGQVPAIETSVATNWKLNESKGIGKRHGVSPPNATNKCSEGGIVTLDAVRGKDGTELAGRTSRPETGAPELSHKMRVSSKNWSGESSSKFTSGWRDSAAVLRRSSATAAIPSPTMPSPSGADSETRLRKELRELERQRRRREEQKATRRLDRAKAIASERSKYGTGLTPRLEQFFSRILRLQQQKESDGQEDTVPTSTDADRETRSPVIDMCAVECRDTVISSDTEAAIAVTGRRVEQVPCLKSMDGNNNSSSSSLGDDAAKFTKT